jgi:hypothetical protein
MTGPKQDQRIYSKRSKAKEWWGDSRQETLTAIKAFLDTAIQEEMAKQLQAWKYGLAESHLAHRNGCQYWSPLS